jgi:hypothetical protein
MPEEIKDINLGKAISPDLGQAGDVIKEPIKKETLPPPPPTDFKIAEIWIRSGQIMLDAAETFWQDRCRALGVLEFCKEIVKTAQAPKNKIIPASGGMLNFARNIFKRKK